MPLAVNWKRTVIFVSWEDISCSMVVYNVIKWYSENNNRDAIIMTFMVFLSTINVLHHNYYYIFATWNSFIDFMAVYEQYVLQSEFSLWKSGNFKLTLSVLMSLWRNKFMCSFINISEASAIQVQLREL